MLFTSNARNITSFKIIQAKRSFVECGDWFADISRFELCNRVSSSVCVSLNNEKICRAISEDKIAVCEKTAGLGSGNSSDLDLACLKVLVPIKIFQIQDMLNENRFLDTLRLQHMAYMTYIL